MTRYHALRLEADLALVEAFRRDRSEVAARVIIERFSPRLLRTAARLLAGHGDPEDVVQEAWIRAFSAIGQYRSEAAFGTWVTRIVMRVAFDQLRTAEARRPPRALDEARTVQVIPIDHELAVDIDQAIARLSTMSRAVFVMHDIEGATHSEIAGELGIAVGTSKVHLFNARRRLRALLGDRGDTGATA